MKVYPDADEKLVKTFIAYADADEGNLFSDEGKTIKLTKDGKSSFLSFSFIFHHFFIIFSNFL